MDCPKCGGELMPSLDPTTELQDYQDVTFECVDNDKHIFFIRIKKEDLMDG